VRHFLAIIILATVLVSGQACLGVIVTKEQGLFFRYHGDYYGIYDSRYAEEISMVDGKIVGGSYWSGVSLGPLGRLGVYSNHPWIRNVGPFVLVIAGVAGLVISARRFSRRGNYAHEAA
jgi:hypothetical protein